MTFYVFHDLYESYRLVYVKEIVKYDWQIWGGGGTWGQTGLRLYLQAKLGKMRSIYSPCSRTESYSILYLASELELFLLTYITDTTLLHHVRCYSFCGENGKCKLKKWILMYIYILRISTDVFLFSFLRQLDGGFSSLALSSPPPPTCSSAQ